MKLRERMARALAGGYIEEVARDAAQLALREAAASVDPDDHLYRRLGEVKRDLASYDHTAAQDAAFSLYQRNDLGHRLTELMPDFIVGDGITWSCSNPEVARVIEEWWTDDTNDFDRRQHDFALELGLYGELFPEALTGEVSGVVQLGYIDPSQVKRVEMLRENPMVADKVVIKRPTLTGTGSSELNEKELLVVRDRGNGVLEGDVFLWQVNSVSNSTRGWPDLMHVSDWLDIYDDMLWDMAERARMAKAFIWDVEIDGDEAAVEAWIRKHGETPRSGSVRAHNQGVKWQAVAPQMGSFETAAEAEVLLAHIAAGAGVPKHWLSSTADVNRATALEMGSPTVRKLTRRQAYFLSCTRRVLRYVVERAADSKRIPSAREGLVPVFTPDGQPLSVDGEAVVMPAWRTVRLHAPEISSRDAYRAGQMLLQLTQALAQAEASGWFGMATSRRVLATSLAMLGVETEPSDLEQTAPEPEERPAPPRRPGEQIEEAVVRLLTEYTETERRTG